MLLAYNQWSNAEPYVTYKPAFVGGLDSLRVGAYTLYEQIYWTIPEALKLTSRGTDDNPIYIPSSRSIVETMHRYLAPGFGVICDPSLGSDTEKANADLLIKSLFARERMASRFSANKRYGIIRGDWLFRIMADPARPEGSRISILPVDPAGYFEVTSEDDVDTVIGVDIASIVEVDGKELVQKTSYRKTTGTGGPSPITVEEGYYEQEKSGLPGKDQGSPVKVTLPMITLPSPIDQIPVYHIQNFDEPGTPWGSAESRGLERLHGAINQSVSDEDLALALEGLGVYYCDGGPPIDEETGLEVPWDIGPARVVEIPTGKAFGRVKGIDSVAPMQDHLRYLHEQLDIAGAVSDVAKGRGFDVQVAESGIALLLRLGPLLARAGEKEQVVTDVMVNMLFDLRKWFAAFEGAGTSLDNILWIPTYGDKIPQNRSAQFKEIMDMLGIDPPIVSRAWGRKELAKIGYEFPDDAQMLAEILAEKTAISQVESDVTGARVENELGAIDAPPADGGVTGGAE